MTTNRPFDPWAPVLRHVVQPLYYLRHRDRRFRRLRELERNQWMPREKLELLQLERTNAILRHAYETTDFYRQRLDDCGIGGRPLGALSELRALKPIRKADLQEHGDAMISHAYRKDALVRDASGGSTGSPTVFYKDADRHNLRRADQYRHDRWTGWDIGDRWALIWGARKDLIDDTSRRERLVERFLERRISLDAFELTDDGMLRFAERLADYGPKMILGYAGALDRFASLLLTSGFRGKIRPLAIVSSAECLTRQMRTRIQSAFDCDVLDRYGSREVGLIASECRARSGLHINGDNLLVEVLNDGETVRPGQSGDVVITDFWNFGMPLIRYNMDDCAVASSAECECGRTLPMLQSVSGRASDFLTAADGTRIHGEFFTHLFYGIPCVARFQFVQESLREVTIRIVPVNPEAACDLTDVVQKTRSVLGDGTKVKVEVCKEIPATPSGKFRFTVSRIPDGEQNNRAVQG